MVADHWFIQIKKVLEAMEIISDTTRIRLAMFQLESEAQIWWKWARTSRDLRGAFVCKFSPRDWGENRDDMSWLRVGDLGDSTHSGPEDHGHVRVRCHPGDGWLTAYKVIIDCERRRVTTIRITILVWYFGGTSMIFCPIQYKGPGVRDS